MPKHQFTHRVIYQDTDAEGVVYYANYLGFFEKGRTELIRSLGISLKELKEKQGIVFAVEKVECDYSAPARYDDELTIETEIEKTTGARIVFQQTASRAKVILVRATITLFSLDFRTFKPQRLPKEILPHLF